MESSLELGDPHIVSDRETLVKQVEAGVVKDPIKFLLPIDKSKHSQLMGLRFQSEKFAPIPSLTKNCLQIDMKRRRHDAAVGGQ